MVNTLSGAPSSTPTCRARLWLRPRTWPWPPSKATGTWGRFACGRRFRAIGPSKGLFGSASAGRSCGPSLKQYPEPRGLGAHLRPGLRPGARRQRPCSVACVDGPRASSTTRPGFAQPPQQGGRMEGTVGVPAGTADPTRVIIEGITRRGLAEPGEAERRAVEVLRATRAGE
jgi:hypothetical protein